MSRHQKTNSRLDTSNHASNKEELVLDESSDDDNEQHGRPTSRQDQWRSFGETLRSVERDVDTGIISRLSQTRPQSARSTVVITEPESWDSSSSENEEIKPQNIDSEVKDNTDEQVTKVDKPSSALHEFAKHKKNTNFSQMQQQGLDNHGNTLLARVHKGTINESGIKEIFEDVSISNGGPVKSVKFSTDLKAFIVIFESPIAYAVVKNKNIACRDIHVEVTLLKPSQPLRPTAGFASNMITIPSEVPPQPQTTKKEKETPRYVDTQSPPPKRRQRTKDPNVHIEITGFDDDYQVDLRKLKQFMTSAGGDNEVLDCEYDEVNRKVCMTFSEQSGRAILEDYFFRKPMFQQQNLIMRPVDIVLTRHNPYESGRPTAAVVVTGLNSCLEDSVCETELRQVLHNEKTGLGGPIGTVNINRHTKSAIVMFHRISDAECVLKYTKQNKITIGDRAVTIKTLYSTFRPTSDPFEVDKPYFLKNLPHNVSRNILENYFKQMEQCSIKQIIYGTTPGTALVFFDDHKPDYHILYEAICTKPLMGKMLEVDLVPKPFAVEAWSSKALRKMAIQEYITRQYGIKHSTIEIQGDECLILRFCSSNEAQEVTKTREQHTVQGEEVTIRLHYECLGLLPPSHDFSIPAVRIPTDICKYGNINVLKFIKKQSVHCKEIEDKMKSHKCSLVWNISSHGKGGKGEVVLRCLLSKADPECKTKAMTWENDVDSEFEEVLSNYGISKIDIPDRICPQLHKDLSYLNAPNQDCEVTVDVLKKEAYLIGTLKAIENKKKVLAEVVKKIEEELYYKENVISMTFVIKIEKQFKLLKKLRFFSNLKTEFKHVKLEIKSGKEQKLICIHGIPKEASAVWNKLEECIGNMDEQTISFSKAIELLFHEIDDIHIEIEGIYRYKMCIYTYKEKKLTILAPTTQYLKELIGCIKDKVCEGTLSIPKKSNRAAQAKKKIWQEFSEKLRTQEKLKVILVLEEKERQINFAAIGEYQLIWSLKSTIDKFLQDNRDVSWLLYTPSPITDYVKRWQYAELSKFGKENDIDLIFPDDGTGILLRGLADDVDQMKQIVHTSVEKIEFDKHPISKPGMPKYFISEEGKHSLRRTEEACKILIVIEDGQNSSYKHITKYMWDDIAKYEELDDIPEDNETDDNDSDDEVLGENCDEQSVYEHLTPNPIPQKEQNMILSTTLKGTVTVQLIHGDLTEQRVDAVVNAANVRLDHIGGLAKAIVDKGGDIIQQKSSEYVKRHGELNTGEVYVSDSGKLLCRKVIHVVGPKWKKDDVKAQKNAEQDLDAAILNVLQEASNQQFSSLAMSAVSGGIYYFPIDICTQIIVKRIWRFVQSSQTTVTDIRIVELDDKIVTAFAEAINQEMTSSYSAVDDDDNVDDTDSNKRLEGEENNFEKIYIEIVIGNMTKQVADAIINITSGDLKLTSNQLSADILAKAGKSVQVECKQKYPDGIECGEVAITNGGDMNCKKIYHGVCQGYRDDSDLPVENMQKFVKRCLLIANQSKYKTIAFPAIGTRNLDYPPEVVFDCLVSAIRDFSAEEENVVLKRAFLVVDPKDHHTREVFSDKYQELQDSNRGHEDPTYLDVSCITVLSGEITEIDADAIITTFTPDKKIDPEILNTAGQEIEKECYENRDEDDSIDDWEIVTTSGGEMRCQQIFHIACQFYDENDEETQENMKNALKSCLELAERNGYSTVAFKPIGTETYEYPDEVFCEILGQAVHNFSEENLHRYMREVQVIVPLEDKNKFEVISAPFSLLEGDVPIRCYNINAVKVLAKDITEHEADVLVCNIPSSVADAVLNAAGSSVREHLEKIMNADNETDDETNETHDDEEILQVYSTSGGDLQYKELYFIKLDDYNEYNEEEKLSYVTDIVTKCLEKASEAGHMTVAFPPLGMGGLGYPREKICQAIAEAVHHVFDQETITNITEVQILVLPKEDSGFQMISGILQHGDDGDLPSQCFDISVVDIIRRDISEQRADVVVNMITSDMINCVSGLVCDAAGSDIQDEINENLGESEELENGEIVTTSGGEMSWQEIYHVQCLGYDPEDSETEKIFATALTNCWSTAHNSGYKTIALTSIDICSFGFPINVACNIIGETVNKFLEENPKTSIRNIQVIIPPAETLKFQAVARIFSKSIVDVPTTKCYDVKGIHVFSSDITDHKADVVLNTTTQDLNLCEGIESVTILNAAGLEIQDQCYQHSAENVNDGDIITTSGGQLKCRKIYHIICPQYDTNDPNTVELLTSAMTKCLENASVAGYKSMILPPIGTGRFGFPVNIMCNVVGETVGAFFSEHSDTSLKEVNIIVPKNEQIKFQVISGIFKKSADDATPSKLFEEAHFGVALKDITMHEVDIVVNVTTQDLSLKSGRMSSLLLQRAGSEIQEECKEKSGGVDLDYGHVIKSSGGQMPCSEIYHVTCAEYDPDDSSTVESIVSAVETCLEEALISGHKTIAFPLLGTGEHGFPVDLICKVIWAQVKQMWQKEEETELEQVQVIVQINEKQKYQDAVHAFIKLQDGDKLSPAADVWHFGIMIEKTGIEVIAADIISQKNYPKIPRMWGVVELLLLCLLSEPFERSDSTINMERIFIKSRSISTYSFDVIFCFLFPSFHVVGILANCICGRADVIVNPTTTHLDLHTGAVSNAIVDAAGPEIEDECRRNSGGSLQHGQMVASSGGSLECKAIYHVACSAYNRNNTESLEHMHQAIAGCLSSAADSEFQSIVFPPIGTGNMNFTANMIVLILKEELGKLITERESISLSKITITVPKDENSKYLEFVSALKETKQEKDEENEDDTRTFSVGQVKVDIVQGDITTLTQKVDVIVNSVATDLDLESEGISQVILGAAGESIQAECNEQHPNGIDVGEFVLTGPGNLNCTDIYHAAWQYWSGGSTASKQIFNDLICDILKTADENKKTSIAFPVVGIDREFPERYVAANMFGIMRTFDATHLKHIIIVVDCDCTEIQKEIIDFFSRSMRNVTSLYKDDYHEQKGVTLPPETRQYSAAHRTRYKGHKNSICSGGMIVQVETDQKLEYSSAAAVTKEEAAGCPKDMQLLHYKIPKEKNRKEWKNIFAEIFKTCSEKKLEALSLNIHTESKTVTAFPIEVMANIIAEQLSVLATKKLQILIRLLVRSEEEQKQVLRVLRNLLGGRSITFHLFGTSKKNIEKAKACIDEICNDKCEIKLLPVGMYREFLNSLKPEELDELKQLQENFPVKIIMTPTSETQAMRIEGLPEDVNKIKDFIDQKKHNHMQKKEDAVKERAANVFSSTVLWYYVNTQEGREISYDPRTNFEIEGKYDAWKKTDQTGKVRLHIHDVEYVINFQEMQIYDNSVGKKSTVSLTKHVLSELPKHWSGNLSSDETHWEEDIDKNSKRFKQIKEYFEDTIGYYNEIKSIVQIENPLLHRRFEVRKKDLISKNSDELPNGKGNERHLWHGTSVDAIEEINSTGFNRSFCGKNGTAYGNGVYFAVNASYSNGYAYSDDNGFQSMYLCRVLTGVSTLGDSEMVVPPQRKGLIKYDSVTDTEEADDAGMFVVFYDDQSYPEYLIKYT